MDAESLISDFKKVAKLSGICLAEDTLTYKHGHSPSSLPKGYGAVYVFMHGDKCLKVGKVGTKSHARYKSQHYNAGSSFSNLAKSLLSKPDEYPGIAELEIRDWIKNNTQRTNFLYSAGDDIFALNLLEAFIQCRLKPRFEGFRS